MSKYFKNIEDGYLVSISTGTGNEKITQEEYESILAVIHSAPIAESGYLYKLRADLTWELVEAPIVPEDPEATEADYQAALRELGVKFNEEI